MGRSNNSTKSGHRIFVTGCASNAIPTNLPAGPGAVLVVLDGGQPPSPPPADRGVQAKQMIGRTPREHCGGPAAERGRRYHQGGGDLLGGVVTSQSIRVGGDEMDQAIIAFATRNW